MPTARILTADIGGTNCRFGLFAHEQGMLRLCRTAWHDTGGMYTLADVLRACDSSELGLSAREADALVLAVAGPVLDPLHGQTTNASLCLDLHNSEAEHGLRHARVINDFAAQAYAVLTPAGAQSCSVFSGALPPQEETRGIIGAGTGLGTASLLRDSANEWLAVPSETGHTIFPFLGAEETDFHNFIRSELHTHYACCDQVLTGLGLSLLHRFLTGHKLSPQEISAQALGHDSPTRRWFARLYARMCRTWALVTLCHGGLYITGGIAAKNPDLLTCPEFAEEFFTAPHYRDLLERMPVRLMTDENSGLWGAAYVGLKLLNEAQ